MSLIPDDAPPPGEPRWVTRLGQTRPDVVLMAPYLVYLGLLAVRDWVPDAYLAWAIALRGVGSVAVFWLFRRYFPPLGRAHIGLAVVAGVIAAAGWVLGEKLFDSIQIADRSLGGRFFLFPGRPEVNPQPFEGLSDLAKWSQIVLRITVATTAVPIVEELFWRAFLLRAFIDWHHFERIPLGTFTWTSFLATSLLSTVQHPDNWLISIFCWFFYNGLMYWKKSILFLMVVHGVTNLVLYAYVVAAGDWMFW